MPLLIIAFALLLSQVSPMPLMFGASIGWVFLVVLGYGIPLLVSWWSLNALNVRPFVAKLPRGRRLLKIGVAIIVIQYLIGAASGLLLKFISPGIEATLLILIMLAGRACLFAGALMAFCVELPRARLTALVRLNEARRARAASAPASTSPALR